MKISNLSTLAVVSMMAMNVNAKKTEAPNIILFTADDLGWMSLGCYGATADVTPHLDQFAREGILFNHGYVNAAISSPSRKIMCTGLYGHNSGAMGFKEIDRSRNVPILMDILKNNGYTTGILGKVSHSSPYKEYVWDYMQDYKELGRGRNPERYAGYAEEFIEKAQEEGKPFYFMINSHDPHRPFHNPNDPKALRGDAAEPSRLFSPEEVDVPGFVPDTKEVREELSHYFNSTRRLDDTFGAVMQVLEELDCADNTLVIFVSDNGIAIPFAKANVYYASNRTPFMARWPKQIQAGQINDTDFVSEVDFLTTFLDVANIPLEVRSDGRSFKELLMGQKGGHRDCVYTQIDRKIGGSPTPMRSVMTEDFAYIYNAWSDGKRVYKNNNEGEAMKCMNALAQQNQEAAQRVELYRKRAPEELYNLKSDPSALHNLIDCPKHRDILFDMQALLREQMVAHQDTLLPVFDARHDFAQKEKALLKAYPELIPKKRTPNQPADRKSKRKANNK